MFHLHARARLNTIYSNYTRLVYVNRAWYARMGATNVTGKKRARISFIRGECRTDKGRLIGFLGRRIKCFEKSITRGYQLRLPSDEARDGPFDESRMTPSTRLYIMQVYRVARAISGCDSISGWKVSYVLSSFIWLEQLAENNIDTIAESRELVRP